MDVLFWGAPYGGVAPPILPMMESTIRHGIPERTAVLERHTEVRTRDGALDVRPLDLDIEPLVPAWLDLPR